MEQIQLPWGPRQQGLLYWPTRTDDKAKSPARGYTHLQLLNGLFAGGAWSRYFDQVGRVLVCELSSVRRLPNLMVRSRSRELNLSSSTTLQVIEMLSTSSNHRTMLCVGDFDKEDYAITQRSCSIL